MKLRPILTHLAAAYLGAGIFAGLLMQAGIPALNALGVGYIALTWPRQIYCAPEGRCAPLPESMAPYVFSFPETTEAS